jgi:ABC-type polysaccharide/polyol phosphate export permease
MILNPVAHFTQMYQEIIVQGVVPSAELFMVAFAFSAVVFVLGNMVFNDYRDSFAELV